MINKYMVKIIKLLIIIASKFRKNQEMISNLIIWLNILQGKNAPVNNEIEANFIKKYLNQEKSNIILDVGAHLGTYTENLIEDYENSKFYLFEPSKKQFTNLKQKFAKYDNVKIFNVALSDKNGISKLHYNTDGDSQASLTKRVEIHRDKNFKLSEEVTTLTLSNFWEDNLNFQQIDLLKLDIEGEEFKVLKNIKDLLYNIHLIQFEFGEANIATKVFFKDFWSLLTNSGFKIYRYTHYEKLISVDHYTEYDEFFRFTNYLAINLSLNKKI